MTTLHSPKRSLGALSLSTRQKPSRPKCDLLPGDLRACTGDKPTSHRLAMFGPALDCAGPTAPRTQLVSLEALRILTRVLGSVLGAQAHCGQCRAPGTPSQPVLVPYVVHFVHGDAHLWLVCTKCGAEQMRLRKRGEMTTLLREAVKRAMCRVDAVVDLPEDG